jgi:signal peptidase I
VAVLAAILAFVPATLEGNVTYVTTHGVSMLPRFHAGDLAVLTRTDTYKVGDVAGYESALLHTVVLHRIIAVNGGSYRFKGDHNNFVDPESPTRAQLIGKLWVRIPKGGVVLSWFGDPLHLVVLALAILALTGAGEASRVARRRRRARLDAGGRRLPPPAAARGGRRPPTRCARTPPAAASASTG